MNSKRFRTLHKRIGSHELFSYWFATELLQFRRLFGLRYQPNSTMESDAFYQWLKSQHAKK